MKGGRQVANVNQASDEALNEEMDLVTEEENESVNEVQSEENATLESTEGPTLEEQLEKKSIECQNYVDKLQRTMAEYDNFRKRTIKEKTQIYENGAKEVLEKLLPVIDNFERAISSIKEDEKNTALAQGVDLIYKQLINMLNEAGAKEIEAVGVEFDPNLHHAVAHEVNDAYGENEVIEVLQKGYLYQDRVIRHSMVRVAN